MSIRILPRRWAGPFFRPILGLLCLTLSACTSTHLARGSDSATVQIEWLDLGTDAWRQTNLLRAGDQDLGYRRFPAGTLFTVGAGPQRLQVWFHGHVAAGERQLWQSLPAELAAELRPGGRYQLRSAPDRQQVRFSLVDLASGDTVAASAPARLVAAPPIDLPAAVSGYTPPMTIFTNNRPVVTGTLPPSGLRR